MSRPIHYRSMGYFDAVRRYGSIREAARRLDVAASAVNRQILKFEGEVGLPLFERLSDGMKLTPAGEIFARHAIAVLQDEKRAASEFDALKGLRRRLDAASAAQGHRAGINFPLGKLAGGMGVALGAAWLSGRDRGLVRSLTMDRSASQWFRRIVRLPAIARSTGERLRQSASNAPRVTPPVSPQIRPMA